MTFAKGKSLRTLRRNAGSYDTTTNTIVLNGVFWQDSARLDKSVLGLEFPLGNLLLLGHEFGHFLQARENPALSISKLRGGARIAVEREASRISRELIASYNQGRLGNG
ncbi:hypothetical protein ACFLX4_00440 [Chloroflexota bacterium]